MEHLFLTLRSYYILLLLLQRNKFEEKKTFTRLQINNDVKYNASVDSLVYLTGRGEMC